MKSSTVKKLASLVTAALLFFYVGNQIYSANYSSVKTETAVYADMQDNVQADGIAIRQETLIEQPVSGVIRYPLGAGGRVAKSGVVAEVYSSTQAAGVQQKLKTLDEEIEKLTSLGNPGDTYSVNPDLLDEQIKQQMTTLLSGIHKADYQALEEEKSDLLHQINLKQIVTGKAVNFNDRLTALKSQRASVASQNAQAIGSVSSPVAGYFVGQADGYEKVLDYASALSLTPAKLREIPKKASAGSGVIGKVSSEYTWYFAAILTADAALRLQVGQNVSISMPFAAAAAFPAQVAAVNQTDKNSEAAVVFSCNYMNETLAAVRRETVQITIGEYQGIRVSQRAVRFEDVTRTVKGKDGKPQTQVTKNVRGVYVMHGNEMEFVQIFPLFSSGNYVICEVVDETSERNAQMVTQHSVQLSDEVIIEGTDLHDGKVVK